jgi:hypothetical protein
MLGVPMKPLQFERSFCGEGIQRPKDAPLDPCAVVLIGNWQAQESQQLSQQFFCHLECFRGKLSNSAYVSIDEMEPGDQA